MQGGRSTNPRFGGFTCLCGLPHKALLWVWLSTGTVLMRSPFPGDHGSTAFPLTPQRLSIHLAPTPTRQLPGSPNVLLTAILARGRYRRPPKGMGDFAPFWQALPPPGMCFKGHFYPESGKLPRFPSHYRRFLASVHTLMPPVAPQSSSATLSPHAPPPNRPPHPPTGIDLPAKVDSFIRQMTKGPNLDRAPSTGLGSLGKGGRCG